MRLAARGGDVTVTAPDGGRGRARGARRRPARASSPSCTRGASRSAARSCKTAVGAARSASPAARLADHFVDARIETSDKTIVAATRPTSGATSRRSARTTSCFGDRPGGHGQDLPRGGDGGLAAAREARQAHHPGAAGGRGRRAAGLPARATSRPRSIPTCARSTTRCTTCSSRTAPSACSSRASIEVAPLAFMRGRTLNHSFIILDEAQNTTSEQMKMFLTRIGFDSKAVVTGDVTQIDLPRAEDLGPRRGQRGRRRHPGHRRRATSTRRDVVRHPLVQRIILAYDAPRARRRGAPHRPRRRREPRTDADAPDEAGPTRGPPAPTRRACAACARACASALRRGVDRLLGADAAWSVAFVVVVVLLLGRASAAARGYERARRRPDRRRATSWPRRDFEFRDDDADRAAARRRRAQRVPDVYVYDTRARRAPGAAARALFAAGPDALSEAATPARTPRPARAARVERLAPARRGARRAALRRRARARARRGARAT